MKTGNKECEKCLAGLLVVRDYNTGKIIEVKNPEIEAANKKESNFMFKIWVKNGSSAGFQVELFAENEIAALAKARKTITAEFYQVQGIREVLGHEW